MYVHNEKSSNTIFEEEEEDKRNLPQSNFVDTKAWNRVLFSPTPWLTPAFNFPKRFRKLKRIFEPE